MGKLWNRAAWALKDRNSIFIASLARRTALRRPEVELAVIRATSHRDSGIDYESVEKVYDLIQISPNYFKPLIWAISRRIEKTRSWVVALKGLMLMHGVFSSNVPAVRRIGRLPFDLANFRDRHSKSWKTWGLSDFIRAYFAFLDHKSALLFHVQERTNSSSSISSLMQALEMLQNMQDLLDKTLKVKPNLPSAIVPLVIEAMDCMVVEIFATHDRICAGITKVLPRVNTAGKAEASAALKIAAKARAQSQELIEYFELCNELCVTNASKPPATYNITKEQIQELEDIINSVVSASRDSNSLNNQKWVKENQLPLIPILSTWDQHVVTNENRDNSTIIITDRWETFDEDNVVVAENNNPYYAQLPLIPLDNNLHLQQCQQQNLPDLITF